MGLFSKEQPGYLGVDIGASGVKIVELKKEGTQGRLIGYGFSENLKDDNKAEWRNDNIKTAQLIRKTIDKANLTATGAIASLPAYSVFISFINLVNIDKKNIDQAVIWETKKIMSMPIEDVNLEWRLIESRIEDNKEHLKIFVTAVPKILVQKYREIFKEAELNLLSLEPEIFSATRSLIGRDKSSFALIDIGAATTNLAIIERGIPMLNRSLDLGGQDFTDKLAMACKVALEEAEQLKYDLGINAYNAKGADINLVMEEAVSPIVNELKYILGLYGKRNNGKIEKIILTGGSAMLVNLAPYLERVLDITTVVGDPWSHISYPVELEPLLKEIGPKLSSAAGLALSFMG